MHKEENDSITDFDIFVGAGVLLLLIVILMLRVRKLNKNMQKLTKLLNDMK